MLSVQVKKLDSQGLREVSFTIYGEPASKANSRRLITRKGKPAFIKSAKALRYVTDFQTQCPKLKDLLEGDLSITVDVWYATRRPDLDVSIILDACQNLVYFNDRQCREQHLFWHLDRKNPRAEIVIRQIILDEN